MTTSLWTDAHLAKLAATFTRCEADLKRLGLTADAGSRYIDRATELRSECGAISIKFDRDFTADNRGTYDFTVNFSPYVFNIWGKTQPMAEALEMARLNLTIVSLAAQWEADFSGQRFTESEMEDPAKVAADDARRAARNELTTAMGLLRTDRRVEVFATVASGTGVELPPNDRRVARGIDDLIDELHGVYYLTILGRRLADSMDDDQAAA